MGNLVIEQVKTARLIAKLQAMDVGVVDTLAKKRVAMVVTAQQHIDAGLSMLIAVPMVSPVVRSLEDT